MSWWPFKKKQHPNETDHVKKAIARAHEHCKRRGYRFAAVVGYKDFKVDGKNPECFIYVVAKDLTKFKLASGLRHLASTIQNSVKR